MRTPLVALPFHALTGCRPLLALSLATLLGGSSQSNAAPLVIGFTGNISNQGSFSDPTGLFSQGQAISGFWTVETTTADSDASPTRGAYSQVGTPAFKMMIGGSTFESTDSTLQLLNNHTLGIGTIDAYDVLGGDGVSSVPSLTVNQMQITLRDTVNPLDALSNDLLPTTAPNPASFDQVGQVAGQITGNLKGQSFFLNLEIKSTHVVPEPTSWVALLSGVLTAAGMCVRRAYQ